MDQEGNDIRDGIYLPEGEWVDYFTGDLYTGNRIINNYDAPLWKLPVFVKAAAIIPMTVPHNQPDKIPAGFRAYEIYGKGNSTFTEYDDDGKTQAYLDGEYALTQIESRVEGDRLEVTVHPTQGTFDGFCKDKVTEFRVNVTARPKRVTLKAGNRNIKLQEAATLEELHAMLSTHATDYWQSHYTFGCPSHKNAKALTPASLNLIVLNTIVPLLYAYGQAHGQDEYCTRAIRLLDPIKAENNYITRQWAECGIRVDSAADSQALIQLKKEYCDRRYCLHCRFGYEFLKQNHKLK